MKRYIPLPKWNQFHPWPPIGGLRHLVEYRETNGFAKVLKRPNRVWLIDETAFFEWIKEREFKWKKEAM